MRIREAQKHTDPDADPEHWYIYVILRRKKSHKEIPKQWKSRFSLLFCLMMEGSGTVLVTHGSRCESGRPKNIRIRINETASKSNAFQQHLADSLNIGENVAERSPFWKAGFFTDINEQSWKGTFSQLVKTTVHAQLESQADWAILIVQLTSIKTGGSATISEYKFSRISQMTAIGLKDYFSAYTPSLRIPVLQQIFLFFFSSPI
jgi:hypothetical protein